MTNDEIREATAALSGNKANILYSPQQWRRFENKLTTLAEEYLKIEGWPEENECAVHRNIPDLDCYECYACRKFNEALRLCKLAAMKEKTRIKENINLK